MPKFLYSNLLLFGAYGISDYSFSCLIESPDEQEALAWGHEVTKAYDQLYGLMPCGDRLSAATIIRNGYIQVCNEPDPPNVKLRCTVGQMPDFSERSAD